MAVAKGVLDKIIDGINKKAGKVVVDRAVNMMEQLKIEFIPTPSLELNMAMGGGCAVGRVIEFAGEQSSGKTSMALEIISDDQKVHPEGVWGWFETEASYDPDYAKDVHGVDLNRIIYWDMDDLGAENGLDVLEALIRSNDLRGVVVNSVAGLSTIREMNSQMAEVGVAETARMMSKLMRKIVAIANKTKTTCIFINQFRATMDKYKPTVTTGGKALGFFASQRVDFNKIKLEAKDGYDEEEAMKVQCRVRKNRCTYTNPYKKCQYIVKYGEGIDLIGEITNAACEQGILRKSGAWIFYEKDDGDCVVRDGVMVVQKDESVIQQDGVLMKWNGAAKLLAFFQNNPDFYTEIRTLMMARLLAGEVKTMGLDVEEVDQIVAEDAELAEVFIEVIADETTVGSDEEEGEPV